jgi:hypothetical protein
MNCTYRVAQGQVIRHYTQLALADAKGPRFVGAGDTARKPLSTMTTIT